MTFLTFVVLVLGWVGDSVNHLCDYFGVGEPQRCETAFCVNRRTCESPTLVCFRNKFLNLLGNVSECVRPFRIFPADSRDEWLESCGVRESNDRIDRICPIALLGDSYACLKFRPVAEVSENIKPCLLSKEVYSGFLNHSQTCLGRNATLNPR